MTDVAELNHDPVSVGESTADFSSAPVGRQIRKHRKTHGKRSLPLDAKSTDRFLRLCIALPRKRDATRTPSMENAEASQDTPQNTPDTSNTPTLHDLIHVHVRGSATFEKGANEDSYEVVKQIYRDPALQVLDEAAKMVAGTYIFQARTAFRLKADGTYWVMGGLGAVYPYPLAIRTGVFPSWKGQIRSLEKLSKRLRKSASQALRLEADTMVSSRPAQMPADLIFEAVAALRKAIDWMQAFPTPVILRSKYRRIVRPETEESAGVVAYVLDRLYREHTGESSLKVKEIEYRIADLETRFLGQNIQYDSDFGSPAVRLQIRAVKRSKIRTGVDRGLRTSFKMINIKMRENDPNRLTAAVHRFWKRLDRHDKAYDAWLDRTEQMLNEGLRRALEAVTYADETAGPVDDYLRKMRNHLDLRKRWVEEYRGHLNAWESPDVEFWAYDKAVRAWTRRWESLWDFPM